MRVMGISTIQQRIRPHLDDDRLLVDHDLLDERANDPHSFAGRTTERYRKTVGATEYFSNAIARRAGNAEPVEQPCRVGQRLDHNADHDTLDLLSGERIDLIANFLVDN